MGYSGININCWLIPLQWRHNERNGVSNHHPHDCLFNLLFRRRSKKTSELRVTGLGVGNSPVTGEFPAQRASNPKNVSISWRHHAIRVQLLFVFAYTYITDTGVLVIITSQNSNCFKHKYYLANQTKLKYCPLCAIQWWTIYITESIKGSSWSVFRSQYLFHSLLSRPLIRLHFVRSTDQPKQVLYCYRSCATHTGNAQKYSRVWKKTNIMMSIIYCI